MTEETLIWSEITVGQVLRKLNRMCVDAIKEGHAMKAKELAKTEVRVALVAVSKNRQKIDLFINLEKSNGTTEG